MEINEESPYRKATPSLLDKSLMLVKLKRLLSVSILAVTPIQADVSAPSTYNDISLILLGRCAMCHMPGGIMGDPPENYRLDSYVETISQVDRARVVPGNALASELYRRIIGYAQPRMPFNGPPFLSDDEIKRIGQWINDGARDATGAVAPEITGARIRLHGRLNKRWELDGLELELHSGTRIKKSPAPGSYVRVRGRLGAKGEIIVDRIKIK